MLKAKIIQTLKAKYKNLGFGEKAFDAVATMLEATVKEESEIDAAVEGVESLIKGFQSDTDSRITAAVKKAQTEKPEEKKEEKEEKAPTKNDEVPTWAQGLVESNKALLAKVTALESGKTTESRKATLESKLNDVSPSIKAKILRDFNRMNFETNEDFEAFLTETEDDLKTFGQESSGQGSNKSFAPMSGQKPGGTTTNKQLDAEIESWAKAGQDEVKK